MAKQTNNILPQNEKEFFNKYGISLSERWNEYSSKVREEALDRLKSNISNETITPWEFQRDEILRVVIGYINRDVLKATFNNANSVTCVLMWEPEESIFLAGCVLQDITELINSNRLVIAIGRDSSELKRRIEAVVFENNIKHRRIVVYGQYKLDVNASVDMFREIFGEIAGDIQSNMNFRKQFEQAPYENMLYAVNQLSNNSTSRQLFDAIPTRQIPVIIVAAGPSLMKNCEELKRAKGRALIIAVARAMETLSERGIEPDMGATTDPNSPYYLEYDNKKEYTLLSCIYVNTIFQKDYNGKLVYYGLPMFKECFSCPRTENEMNDGMDTGSVATDIFALFAAAGFSRFILVGQDLAFDDEGYSHTGNEKEESGYYVVETEGIDGRRVKIRSDWTLFKKFYEKKIAERNDIEVIDATEGGALIRGTQVMTLKDAIDKYCTQEYPIGEWIGYIPKGDGAEKRYIDEWFAMQDEMSRRTGDNLARIVKLNRDILDIWNDTGRWDDEFAAKCKKYDVMYKILMEGSDSTLLRAYCSADLERYIEDAFILEGDENAEARMRNEGELFSLMEIRLKSMKDYIRSIRTDVSAH